MHEELEPYLLLHDAVIVTDHSHRILNVNKSYEEITGYQRNAIIGCKENIVKSPYTPQKTYLEMNMALSINQPWQGIFTNKKKDGSLWHSSISISPLQIDEQTYYIGVFRENSCNIQ